MAEDTKGIYRVHVIHEGRGGVFWQRLDTERARTAGRNAANFSSEILEDSQGGVAVSKKIIICTDGVLSAGKYRQY